MVLEAGRMKRPAPRAYERLSIHDQSNLWAEAADTPMHIIAVMQLKPEPFVDTDGHLKLDEIRQRIAGRMDRAPRLRQVVRPGSMVTGPPVWIDEVGFDLGRHVRAATIPAPGGEAELLQVVSWIDEQLLDRSHPLWQLWLLTGLANRRVVMMLKLHHAVADGLAAVQLMASLFDFAADGRGDDAPASPGQPETPPGRWSLTRDNAAIKARRLTHGLARLRGLAEVWRTVGTTLYALRFILEQARRAPRCSINRPIGPHRRLAVIRIPLDEAKNAAHAHGGRVNDLLLALVAGGLRALLLNRGERIDGLELLTSVPVSMRHDTNLGNEVGAIIVPLRIDAADASDRLEAVVSATAAAKRAQSAAAGAMAFSLTARLGLARLLSRHQRFVNLFITNVAGPPMPVDVLNGRLLDVIPVTPIAGNCTLGFGALSYNGCVTITAVADADQVPDLDAVIEGMRVSWAALKTRGSGAELAS
jgi:diacylglycerol O-acyltransferase / wax synthase